VGLLAEDHAAGSSLGETATTIIADQFERLRDGDRFYYENTFSGSELREIENTTLADVIERNTNNESLQSNVFFFTPTIAGTVTSDQVVAQQATNQNRNNRRSGRPSDNETTNVAMEGMEMELLDSDGNVVATAVTDSDGRYEFDSFDRTGVYSIRMASSDVDVLGEDTIEVLVSSADVHLDTMDFKVSV